MRGRKKERRERRSARATTRTAGAQQQRSESGGAWKKLRNFIQKRWRYFVVIATYVVPAWYASSYLLELSKSALWLPPEWRDSVRVFGIALGLICFNVARTRVAEATEKRCQPNDPRPLDPRREGKALAGAALWFGLSIALFLVHTLWRYTVVVPFEPSTNLVLSRWGGTDAGLPASEAIDLSGLPSGVHLERRGTAYRGSLLVPPLFMMTPETRRMFERRTFPGTNGLEFFLNEEPEHLLDILERRESSAVGLCMGIFVILHVVILATFSFSIGYVFSPVEEACFSGVDMAMGAVFG